MNNDEMTKKQIQAMKTDLLNDISHLLHVVNNDSLSQSTVMANVIFEKCQKLYADQERKVKTFKIARPVEKDQK